MGVRTVLHLAGSPTDDFSADLSRLYAADCVSAVADLSRWTPLLAWVSPDGSWRFPSAFTPDAISAADAVSLDHALGRLGSADVALPQLFCHAGMTTYRALLDLLGIPFVGNRADVMALGAHKGRCKAVVAGAGVRVPAGVLVRRGEQPEVPLPAVVKPADADNSVGISLVRSASELPAALDAAFAHAHEVLVEEYVELGREVRCGVLERNGELVVLPLEEYAVNAATKPVRDAADKLARGADGELGLVAKDAEHAWIVDPADPVCASVGALARTAFRALGCRHYGLFDVRIDPAGEPVFLEAGLYCSFARTSVVAVMAAAAGIGVADLFAQCVDAALST